MNFTSIKWYSFRNYIIPIFKRCHFRSIPVLDCFASCEWTNFAFCPKPILLHWRSIRICPQALARGFPTCYSVFDPRCRCATASRISVFFCHFRQNKALCSCQQLHSALLSRRQTAHTVRSELNYV